MFISIVIPAYNEAANIAESLLQVYTFFAQYPAEIVVVDDGSTDDTSKIVREQCPYANLKLITLPQNRGKGHAVKAGVLASKGSHVLVTDADLSVPLGDFEKLYRSFSPEAPVVIGSRGLKESKVKNAWYRVLLGKFGNKLIQFIIPGIEDSQCGFKLFDGEVAREVFRRQRLEGFGFDFEVLFIAQKFKYPIREVPVSWTMADRKSSVKFYHYFSTLLELGKVIYNDAAGKYGKRPVYSTAPAPLAAEKAVKTMH
ncbi:MAG TPA: dolichyl-phosphate beta-glucosyltransferase [Cytophagales bacterium]|jgi:dolichyl-phosphate beta-glucosyltransferase